MATSRLSSSVSSSGSNVRQGTLRGSSAMAEGMLSQGTVTVTVRNAKNICDSKSRAFVLVTLEQDHEKTHTGADEESSWSLLAKSKVEALVSRFVHPGDSFVYTDVSQGSDPSWEEKLEIQLPCSPAGIVGLRLRVLDSKKSKSEALIGEYFVKAKELMTHPVIDRWCPLGEHSHHQESDEVGKHEGTKVRMKHSAYCSVCGSFIWALQQGVKCTRCRHKMHSKCSMIPTCAGVSLKKKTAETSPQIRLSYSFKDALISACQNTDVRTAARLVAPVADRDRVYFCDSTPPYQTALEICMEIPDMQEVAGFLIDYGADMTRPRFKHRCDEKCDHGEGEMLERDPEIKDPSALEVAARKGLTECVAKYVAQCEAAPLARFGNASRKLSRANMNPRQRLQTEQPNESNRSQFFVLGVSKKRPRVTFEFTNGSNLIHEIWKHNGVTRSEKVKLLDSALRRRGADINLACVPAIPSLGESSRYSLLQYSLSPWIHHRVVFAAARRGRARAAAALSKESEDDHQPPAPCPVSSFKVDVEDILALLDWGANPNMPCDFLIDSKTLKRTASSNEFLQELTPPASGSLLHFLCNREIVRELTGLSLNSSVLTIVESFIKNGANLAALDAEGRTPLDVAEATHFTVVEATLRAAMEKDAPPVKETTTTALDEVRARPKLPTLAPTASAPVLNSHLKKKNGSSVEMP